MNNEKIIINSNVTHSFYGIWKERKGEGTKSKLGGGGDKNCDPIKMISLHFFFSYLFKELKNKVFTMLAALGLSETADPVTYTPPEEVRIMFI